MSIERRDFEAERRAEKVLHVLAYVLGAYVFAATGILVIAPLAATFGRDPLVAFALYAALVAVCRRGPRGEQGYAGATGALGAQGQLGRDGERVIYVVVVVAEPPPG